MKTHWSIVQGADDFDDDDGDDGGDDGDETDDNEDIEYEMEMYGDFEYELNDEIESAASCDFCHEMAELAEQYESYVCI